LREKLEQVRSRTKSHSWLGEAKLMSMELMKRREEKQIYQKRKKESTCSHARNSQHLILNGIWLGMNAPMILHQRRERMGSGQE
jgi:hypothetical protein